MTPYEISLIVASAIEQARTISTEDLQTWVSEARQQKSRHDTLDSMLDPTAYMRNRASVDATTEIAEAYAKFHDTIERVRAAA